MEIVRFHYFLILLEGSHQERKIMKGRDRVSGKHNNTSDHLPGLKATSNDERGERYEAEPNSSITYRGCQINEASK